MVPGPALFDDWRADVMSFLSLSVKHGQTWEAARVHFERGITEANATFGVWIRRVEWSADRTSAKLFGPGFEVEMWVDSQEVHARGDFSTVAQLFEVPLKAFLRQRFLKQLPH
jgi:hypothetical protein